MKSSGGIERAIRALSLGDHSQAVFYAQQSVEKEAKAMLEIRGKWFMIMGRSS